MKGMLILNKQIINVQKNHKVSTNPIIEELKIQPTSKAKLRIPLCHMISMPIVRPTLLVDAKKMEHSF
jgi:hypothetical protein